MNIKIRDVHKRYGTIEALAGPDFEIPAGSTFGVLGTNGAGKTTLFKLLVGHDDPDRGRVLVGGIDAAQAGHRVRERVGFLPERVGFPARMTGREVLEVHARVRGVGPDRDLRIASVLEMVDLATAADRAVYGYSNGMRRRLGLAAALLSRPPVLVLDEPTAGLDPRGVETFHRIVERVSQETDATVVLSSHVLTEVERLCDRVAILHEGNLCAEGAVDDLRHGAGTTVHLSIVAVSQDARETIARAAQPYGAPTAVRRRVDIECERSRVFELVDALDPELVETIEIDEPGLAAVFHAAIADSEAANAHSRAPHMEVEG